MEFLFFYIGGVILILINNFFWKEFVFLLLIIFGWLFEEKLINILIRNDSYLESWIGLNIEYGF